MRSTRRSAWFSGLVVGVVAGFLTLELPTLGWLLVVAYAVGALVWRRLLSGVGGLLTGIGVIWVTLLGRVALTCQATGDELGCHAPDLGPWLLVGVTMLIAGLALTALDGWRSRR
jgi:hypothetical protein